MTIHLLCQNGFQNLCTFPGYKNSCSANICKCHKCLQTRITSKSIVVKIRKPFSSVLSKNWRNLDKPLPPENVILDANTADQSYKTSLAENFKKLLKERVKLNNERFPPEDAWLVGLYIQNISDKSKRQENFETALPILSKIDEILHIPTLLNSELVEIRAARLEGQVQKLWETLRTLNLQIDQNSSNDAVIETTSPILQANENAIRSTKYTNVLRSDLNTIMSGYNHNETNVHTNISDSPLEVCNSLKTDDISDNQTNLSSTDPNLEGLCKEYFPLNGIITYPFVERMPPFSNATPICKVSQYPASDEAKGFFRKHNVEHVRPKSLPTFPFPMHDEELIESPIKNISKSRMLLSRSQDNFTNEVTSDKTAGISFNKHTSDIDINTENAAHNSKTSELNFETRMKPKYFQANKRKPKISTDTYNSNSELSGLQVVTDGNGVVYRVTCQKCLKQIVTTKEAFIMNMSYHPIECPCGWLTVIRGKYYTYLEVENDTDMAQRRTCSGAYENVDDVDIVGNILRIRQGNVWTTHELYNDDLNDGFHWPGSDELKAYSIRTRMRETISLKTKVKRDLRDTPTPLCVRNYADKVANKLLFCEYSLL